MVCTLLLVKGRSIPWIVTVTSQLNWLPLGQDSTPCWFAFLAVIWFSSSSLSVLLQDIHLSSSAVAFQMTLIWCRSYLDSYQTTGGAVAIETIFIYLRKRWNMKHNKRTLSIVFSSILFCNNFWPNVMVVLSTRWWRCRWRLLLSCRSSSFWWDTYLSAALLLVKDSDFNDPDKRERERSGKAGGGGGGRRRKRETNGWLAGRLRCNH